MKIETKLFLVLGGIGASAMVYQFSVIAALTFILGDTLVLFSVFSGTFLFSMGLGAALVSKTTEAEVYFVRSQLGLAAVGFSALPLIFLLHAELSKSFILNADLSVGKAGFSLWVVGLSAEVVFGTLIGMQLPLLQRIISNRSEIKLELSKILAIDYVGSFFGAAAFPLILFPFLGIFKAVFLAAAFNAIFSAFAVKILALKNRKYMAYAIVLTILIMAAFVKAPLLENSIDQIMYEKN